ncbi:SUKH-4 family immunity protein [Nocardia jejuensis]|uniref:SUKH-4 family immunity protein n=1 Tax=Nocardia jejuensis TaxID=328049 RepID=UPI001470C07F|nr:SUKH-4 family immunity protein [Nocardia jejuensis]
MIELGEEYVRTWGTDNVVKYPRARWIRDFLAPEASYPDIDFIPIDMSAVFTCFLDGNEYDLYERVDLDLGAGEVFPMMVIGAIPADPDAMVFGFDVNGGRVVLLGVEKWTLELVNSSFRSFVEFLHRFSVFIDADTGIEGRADRATELREELMEIDEGAFRSSQSWWAMAMVTLGAMESR